MYDPLRFCCEMIFFCFRKNYHPVVWTKKPTIKMMFKDTSKPYNCGSSVKVNTISDGTLWNFMWNNATNSYYIQRRNCHHLLLFVIFLLSIMSIFTSAFQRFCVCFYYSMYFFKDYGSSFISWTSISSWFLKFSLTQTNRTCKAFHFTWLCMI